jgi:hypothetical protein
MLLAAMASDERVAVGFVLLLSVSFILTSIL